MPRAALPSACDACRGTDPWFPVTIGGNSTHMQKAGAGTSVWYFGGKRLTTMDAGTTQATTMRQYAVCEVPVVTCRVPADRGAVAGSLAKNELAALHPSSSLIMSQWIHAVPGEEVVSLTAVRRMHAAHGVTLETVEVGRIDESMLVSLSKVSASGSDWTSVRVFGTSLSSMLLERPEWGQGAPG